MQDLEQRVFETRVNNLEMGIEQNRTEHTELEPYFWAKRTEPKEPNVIS